MSALHRRIRYLLGDSNASSLVEIELILGLLGAELVARGVAGSKGCFEARRAVQVAREISQQQGNAGNDN